MSIAKLRRSTSDDFAKLTQAIDQQAKTQGGFSADTRFWKPFLDKEKGTGYARIRFLPPKEGEELPYVSVYDHGVKGPSGRYYIENSLTTIGKPDPLSELNTRLWNSGVEADKNLAREWKRRLNYYSNVLVVEDPHNPANVGKVFLYRYGPMIFEMIKSKIKPEFASDASANPFDFFKGVDFVMKIRIKKTGSADFWDYDKSEWGQPSEIYAGNEEEQNRVYGSLHSLKEFITPDKFRSYDELQAKLYEVLGPYVGSGIEVWPGKGATAPASQQPAMQQEQSRLADAVSKMSTPTVTAPPTVPVKTVATAPVPTPAPVTSPTAPAAATVPAKAAAESDEFMQFFESIKRA